MRSGGCCGPAGLSRGPTHRRPRRGCRPGAAPRPQPAGWRFGFVSGLRPVPLHLGLRERALTGKAAAWQRVCRPCAVTHGQSGDSPGVGALLTGRGAPVALSVELLLRQGYVGAIPKTSPKLPISVTWFPFNVCSELEKSSQYISKTTVSVYWAL